MNNDTNKLNQQRDNEIFRQQQTFNSVLNNNMYKQSTNPNNPPNHNLSTNKKSKKQIKIIGIIGIVTIVILIVIIIFGGKLFFNQKRTVDYNETLKIYELKGYYDFDLEILSIENDYVIDEVFHNGKCLAMKVKIKNNSDKDLIISPTMMKFNLLDSSNNEISSLNILMSSTMKDALKEVSSGQEKNGYFYFFDVNDKNKTPNIKNDNIKKLEVEVIKNLEQKGEMISGDYQQYYINLK